MHQTQGRFANPGAIFLTTGQGAPMQGGTPLRPTDNRVQV